MEEMACLLVPLAIALLLSGPVALIVSIVALNKIKEMRSRPATKEVLPRPAPEMKMPVSPPVVAKPSPIKPTEPSVARTVEPPPELPKRLADITPPVLPPAKPITSLEQRIGTKWVLIAGVITVFISAGFFLKFAYEHHWINPWGRIGIVVVAGIVSLVVGEITRRRGYEIAAKGTTALGFAILYAADFAAYRFYGLIGSIPAFATAIVITAAAFAYAVALDEVVAAFLALLGGFLTPIIVSKGENLPVPLFGYVLVLSTGAMLCAFWRKWRAINLLAFVGTFLLYSGWFEKFFRSQLHGTGPPEQMAIALGWLGIFFGVFLVLPLVYGLVNRIIARLDDVLLVVINALWTFYYLWTILFERNQTGLALCSAGLSAAHLAMMRLVYVRCREDKQLRQTLLAIGLAFLTAAIPLYWKMNASIIGWTIEGAVLVFIGLRYRSILTQIGGAIALGLACGKLVWQLPIHTDAFRLVLNPAFGIWVFVSAVLWLCHFLYRSNSRSSDDAANIIAQLFYTAAVFILICAATLEWAAHCKYNLLVGNSLHYISRGQSVIFAAAVLLFAVRPICPRGRLTEALILIALMAGAAFVICSLTTLHTEKFLIFVNWDFAAVFVFLMSMLGCHIRYRLAAESPRSETGILSQALYAVLGLLFVAVLATEWYWHCVYNLETSGVSPELVRGQIIVFSAGVLGFVVKPLCPRGVLPKVWAAGLAVVGSCFAMIMYMQAHRQGFVIFVNPTFAVAGVLIVSLFISAYLLNRRKDEEPEGKFFAVGLTLLAIIVLWVVLSEEIYAFWRCRDLYVERVDNWELIANMWMSVAWAIYGLTLLVGGFWRKLKTLRYLGLSVLGALLLKVFIVDMSAVSTIYRILAFLATGVTLVGVSYLYQFLKKKGFFETGITKD
jgi:uncharacterized membrane protein